MSKEFNHSRKVLINIQNTDDSKCITWYLVRHLNPADQHPAKARKNDEEFEKKLDFKDIKFPVKIRDIHKIEKKNWTSISIFGYENKEKLEIYVSKNTFKRHADLLLVKEEGKSHYVLIKNFNTFVHNQTLHGDRKHFCRS